MVNRGRATDSVRPPWDHPITNEAEPMTNQPTRRRLLRQVTAAVGLGVGTSVAGCLGIITSDRARYYSVSEISVEEFDYGATISAAEAAGYGVDGPYYGTLKEPASGFHPEGIAPLDEQLGTDYLVDHLVFHYSAATRLRASFDRDDATEIGLWDDRAWSSPDPFLPEYLPEEGWLIDRLTLLFDIGPESAQEYVAQLTDVITDEETDIPSINVSETVTFDGAYDDLLRESTATEAVHSGGEGWHLVTYLREDTPIAEVGYRLQSTKATRERGTATYTVQFDRLGAVALEVALPPGETIPVEQRRSVFREMFDALGFPPALVDDVEFDYVGSMW